MNKQSKKIYSSLMNRIAIAMMLNQLIMSLLGALLSTIEPVLELLFCKESLCDITVGLLECAIYLLSFALPMNIFNKMNKNAPREIYEPVENKKMPPKIVFFAVCFTLGATIIASYINYYAVNILWDYSSFTMENLWSVELKQPYQLVIYFAYSAIIPAFAEEYFFRETICKSLTVYGKKTAIFASALLFALMHANIEQIIYAFVGGALLAWVYVETKNIAIPIFVHFLNNGISVIGDIIKAMYGATVSDMYFLISDAVIFALALVSLAVIIIYAKKKGRLIDNLILKPDENGNIVEPLSVSERISGFFSIGIILYTVYSVVTMIGLVCLSVLM